LRADFSDWLIGEPINLIKISKDLWVYQIKLPQNAYIEYAYFEGEERIPDPFNSHTTPNGYGETNHYFYMPGAKPTPLAKRYRDVPKGTVTRHLVETMDYVHGKRRAVYLYQPPTEEPVPLILVWDGREYLKRARLPIIMDNLIAQARTQPAALALVSNDSKGRFSEYGCSEGSLAFILKSVLPLAERNLNLVDIQTNPGSYATLGASMGGLIAMFTALRMPHIFGKVISQSGGFRLGDYDSVVFDLIEAGDPKPVQVWMDVGKYDVGFLLAANRRMYSSLKSKGYMVEYREYSAGHNFPAWRDDVWRGLEFMLAG
jgi:enterochelin esterase family protein